MPKIFKNTFSLMSFFSLFFLFSCEKSTPNVSVKPLSDTLKDDFQKDVLIEVNKLRAKGCECKSATQSTTFTSQPILQWDDILAKTASKHSQDMYVNNYLSHTSKTGLDVVARAKAQGFVGFVVGENLADDYASVTDVMNAWILSYSHCTTMMNSDAKWLGVARYQKKWTMVLATK